MALSIDELKILIQNDEHRQPELKKTTGELKDGIWIKEQIKDNPQITTEELGKLSGYTSKTIKRHILKLTHIKYVGSGYSGHWEIVDDNQ